MSGPGRATGHLALRAGRQRAAGTRACVRRAELRGSAAARRALGTAVCCALPREGQGPGAGAGGAAGPRRSAHRSGGEPQGAPGAGGDPRRRGGSGGQLAGWTWGRGGRAADRPGGWFGQGSHGGQLARGGGAGGQCRGGGAGGQCRRGGAQAAQARRPTGPTSWLRVVPGGRAGGGRSVARPAPQVPSAGVVLLRDEGLCRYLPWGPWEGLGYILRGRGWSGWWMYILEH
jgi:hypothetical protein